MKKNIVILLLMSYSAGLTVGMLINFYQTRKQYKEFQNYPILEVYEEGLILPPPQ